MENTWLIGRTWKPREGWSRPVLTVERQHTHPPIQGGKNKHHSDDRETPCTSHGSILRSRPLSGPQPTTLTPTGTRGMTIEDLRRPWPRGDARTHSEPGS